MASNLDTCTYKGLWDNGARCRWIDSLPDGTSVDAADARRREEEARQAQEGTTA